MTLKKSAAAIWSVTLLAALAWLWRASSAELRVFLVAAGALALLTGSGRLLVRTAMGGPELSGPRLRRLAVAWLAVFSTTAAALVGWLAATFAGMATDGTLVGTRLWFELGRVAMFLAYPSLSLVEALPYRFVDRIIGWHAAIGPILVLGAAHAITSMAWALLIVGALAVVRTVRQSGQRNRA